MTNRPRALSGLTEIIAGYDLFLIDQYGVLHDGHRPFHGSLAALEAISKAGKTSVILTNSGKRAKPNADRLLRIGFQDGSFSHVVSSGEVCWRAIKEGRLGAPFVAGARALLIGRRGEDYELDGIGITLTDDASSADFVLILGSDAPAVSLAGYRQLLMPAARAGLPALCANPDKQMLSPQGLLPAPGSIAQVYRQLGGKVRFIGKPYADIYRFALGLAPEVTASRVLAIGDSVEHDIAGAAHMGLASLLIRGGILAGLNEAELNRLYEEYRVWPAYRLDLLAP